MHRNSSPRRPKAVLTAFGALGTHLRNPWVTAWWSAALPGFGHLLVSNHFTGFILLIWEFVVNTKAHINMAIVLSFTGRFQEASEIVDHRWLLLYAGVYVFAIWSSYTETIEQNKYYVMAEREDSPISPVKVTAVEFGVARKRKPLLAVMWSLLTPGLGHIYARKLLEGFVIMAGTVLIVYMSNFCEAVRLSFLGDFAAARAIVDYDWLLFVPSLCGYAAYASYAAIVELNKYTDAEQARYLKQTYMSSDFIMPI